GTREIPGERRLSPHIRARRCGLYGGWLGQGRGVCGRRERHGGEREPLSRASDAASRSNRAPKAPYRSTSALTASYSEPVALCMTDARCSTTPRSVTAMYARSERSAVLNAAARRVVATIKGRIERHAESNQSLFRQHRPIAEMHFESSERSCNAPDTRSIRYL